MGLGKVAINEMDLAFSQDIQGLVTNGNVNNKYLVYCLLKKVEKFKSVSRGATIKGVTREDLVSIQIPLPPLPTQKHIASILDKADALRQQNRQLLEQYDALLQSTFIEMFGDPVENPKGWEVRKLDFVCSKITDGTHQSPDFTDNGIPFLFVSNIVNNQIIYSTKRFISVDDFKILNKRTPVEIGNLLFTIVGSYGNVAIIREKTKFAFQRHIAYLQPKHNIIDYTFLYGQLQSNYVKIQVEKKVKGVAQKTLNLSELKTIEIIVPPLSLQQHFAQIVEEIESQKQQAQAALAESEALFQGLLVGYFGEN